MRARAFPGRTLSPDPRTPDDDLANTLYAARGENKGLCSLLSVSIKVA